MRLNKRQVLKAIAGGTALLASPPLWQVVQAAQDFIEFTATPSRQSLVGPDGPVSDLWLYNGSTPGPEIRVKQGARVRVRLINNLEEPTTIHWHGIRIVNEMDGVPGLTQRAVMPGETFEYEFVAPDAGTYWYHSHNKTWSQVARGLYGPLIVEEPQPSFDRDHDLTLVIDDWRLTPEGVLDLDTLGSLTDWSHEGRLGNWLTVNGEAQPKFSLNAGEAYRLRLINTSNSRILEIDPDGFGALVLAYDGQSTGTPKPLGYAPHLLGPAQRIDLLVVPEAGGSFKIEEISDMEAYPFASFEVLGPAKPATPPVALPPNPIPEPDMENAITFPLRMSGGAMGRIEDIYYQGRKLEGDDFRNTGQVWAFNGIANMGEKPFFTVKTGETVIIETINDTRFMHAMHVHGFHFRIISRSGSTIDEGKPWRDTFLISPEQTTRVAFVADNPGKWLYHCHMLEHAAAGMITWFVVE